MVGPAFTLGYEYLTVTDSSGKNALHYAVMTKCRDLIERFVALDTDHGKLRSQKDAKGKTPQQYDEKSQFTQCFVTVWDCASVGSNVSMKQQI